MRCLKKFIILFLSCTRVKTEQNINELLVPGSDKIIRHIGISAFSEILDVARPFRIRFSIEESTLDQLVAKNPDANIIKTIVNKYNKEKHGESPMCFVAIRDYVNGEEGLNQRRKRQANTVELSKEALELCLTLNSLTLNEFKQAILFYIEKIVPKKGLSIKEGNVFEKFIDKLIDPAIGSSYNLMRNSFLVLIKKQGLELEEEKSIEIKEALNEKLSKLKLSYKSQIWQESFDQDYIDSIVTFLESESEAKISIDIKFFDVHGNNNKRKNPGTTKTDELELQRQKYAQQIEDMQQSKKAKIAAKTNEGNEVIPGTFSQPLPNLQNSQSLQSIEISNNADNNLQNTGNENIENDPENSFDSTNTRNSDTPSQNANDLSQTAYEGDSSIDGTSGTNLENPEKEQEREARSPLPNNDNLMDTGLNFNSGSASSSGTDANQCNRELAETKMQHEEIKNKLLRLKQEKIPRLFSTDMFTCLDSDNILGEYVTNLLNREPEYIEKVVKELTTLIKNIDEEVMSCLKINCNALMDNNDYYLNTTENWEENDLTSKTSIRNIREGALMISVPFGDTVFKRLNFPLTAKMSDADICTKIGQVYGKHYITCDEKKDIKHYQKYWKCLTDVENSDGCEYNFTSSRIIEKYPTLEINCGSESCTYLYGDTDVKHIVSEEIFFEKYLTRYQTGEYYIKKIINFLQNLSQTVTIIVLGFFSVSNLWLFLRGLILTLKGVIWVFGTKKRRINKIRTQEKERKRRIKLSRYRHESV